MKGNKFSSSQGRLDISGSKRLAGRKNRGGVPESAANNVGLLANQDWEMFRNVRLASQELASAANVQDQEAVIAVF